MTRTVNDWGSLVLAELDGKEPPGTVARLVSEASGHPLPHQADDIGVAAKGLLTLAEALKDPKRILADLAKAVDKHRLDRETALTEQAKAAQKKADMETEYMRHRERIERERTVHEQAIADGQHEIADLRKQAAAALVKAQADQTAAAALKSKLDAKLKVLTAA